MRILSQDNGKYDLPYENIVLEKMMDCNTIYAYTGTGQPFKMAVYSSFNKINKAMEMLHDRYTGRDEAVFEFAHVKRSSTDNFYFQFPQDSEMEV